MKGSILNHSILSLLRTARGIIGLSLASAGTLSAQSSFPSPTHEVTRTSPRTFLAGSGFEDNSVSSFRYLASSNGWTMNAAGTGIVRDGQAFAATHNFGGNYSLFLQRDLGSATRTFSLGAGVWEFSFYAAQRFAGGKYQKQVVEVLANGVSIYREELKPGRLRRYSSKAFRHPGGNITVQIRGRNSAGDHSAVLDYFQFAEVMNWNDSSIWRNGNVSTGINNSVLIPSGSHVYLDQSRLVGNLRIKGSLSIMDSSNTIQLQAQNILVEGRYARLQAGNQSTPYQGNLIFSILRGAANQNIEGFGTRFVAARLGGEISLHGKVVKNYVKVTQTANAGSSQIIIPRTDSWSIGDQILITTTAGAYNTSSTQGWDQTEVKNITNIEQLSGGRSRISLNSALAHTHLGVNYSSRRNLAPARTWSYEVRSYAANLTRNIKIEGAGSPLNSGLGAHMMIMGAHNGMPTAGSAKISNVNFLRMGQRGLVGRYPFHWHMLANDGAGQYVKNCVIQNSFNRMITIHGTHYTEVRGNVGYDHIGHGVFLEDGSEQFNIISENLVALSKQALAGQEVTPTDNGTNQLQSAFPSAVWISNPRNTFERNIVSGTTGTGYWFALNTSPTGLSASDSRLSNINARTSNLISFRDNETVSTSIGIDINDGVNPNSLALDPNKGWRPSSKPQYLDGTVLIGNRVGHYTGLGNQDNEIGFIRSKSIDNQFDTLLASYNEVRDSLFVDRIPANLTAQNASAFHMYDGPGRSVNNHFHGYNSSGSSIVLEGGGAVTKSNWLFQGSSFNHSGSPRIAFNAANGSSNSSSHQMDVVVDIDGRISGTPGAAIVTPHPILRTQNNLSVPSNWRNAYLTEENYITSLINYPGSSHAMRGQTLFTRVDNNTGQRIDAFSHHPIINNSPMCLIANNPRYHYDVLFTGGLPQGGVFTMYFGDSVAGDHVLLRFPGLAGVSPNISGIPQLSNLNQLRNSSNFAYCRQGSDIWVKFVSALGSYAQTAEFRVAY